MAVTILNQPTNPNATKNKLVYTISGSNVNQPQYQYITDIYDFGSGNLLTRLYTYPNLTGNGIVDVARILDDNLEYDNDWKIPTQALANSSFKKFDIRFGEAYGTSISSSVTIFSSSVANYIDVFPGIIDPNQGSFNWLESGSIQILSNQTEGFLSKGNCATFTVYANTGNTNTVTLELLNSSGVNVGTLINAPTSSQNIRNVPFGSGSLFTEFESNDWETLTISITGESTPRVTYNRVRPCDNEGVTFAFINNYGFYDYYSVGNPVRKVTNVQRDIYDQNYVDYSSNTSIYSYEKRGQTQYNTGYTDTFEITTDYVTKATADGLTVLFDSPDVYIQEKGVFIPIVITNTSYDWNMNENRQKLFQYTIQYQYANKRLDI